MPMKLGTKTVRAAKVVTRTLYMVFPFRRASGLENRAEADPVVRGLCSVLVAEAAQRANRSQGFAVPEASARAPVAFGARANADEARNEDSKSGKCGK